MESCIHKAGLAGLAGWLTATDRWLARAALAPAWLAGCSWLAGWLAGGIKELLMVDAADSNSQDETAVTGEVHRQGWYAAHRRGRGWMQKLSSAVAGLRGVSTALAPIATLSNCGFRGSRQR